MFVLNNARSPALLNVVSRPAPGAVSSRDRIRTLLGPLRSSILAHPWASVLWTPINAVGEASAPEVLSASISKFFVKFYFTIAWVLRATVFTIDKNVLV